MKAFGGTHWPSWFQRESRPSVATDSHWSRMQKAEQHRDAWWNGSGPLAFALWRSQKTSLSGLSATSSACCDSTVNQGQLIPQWKWDQLPCLTLQSEHEPRHWLSWCTVIQYAVSGSCAHLSPKHSTATFTKHPAIISPSSDRVLQDPLQLRGQLVCTKTSEKYMEVNVGTEERAAPTLRLKHHTPGCSLSLSHLPWADSPRRRQT